MMPKANLEAAESELARLSRDLTVCECSAPQALLTVEATTGKLEALREEVSALNSENLNQLLRSVQSKARRVHALLEAAVAFHSRSMFGQEETTGTYSPDGTFDKRHQSRIVFEG